MADTTQVTTRIPKDLHRKVKIKSAQTGKPITKIIEKKLKEWVDDDDDEKE